MSQPNIIRIISLTQTCRSHPSQWKGRSNPCSCCGIQQVFYARYRWGGLTLHLGPDLDTALETDPVFTWQGTAERGDSEMTLDELRRLLPAWIRIEEGAEGSDGQNASMD